MHSCPFRPSSHIRNTSNNCNTCTTGPTFFTPSRCPNLRFVAYAEDVDEEIEEGPSVDSDPLPAEKPGSKPEEETDVEVDVMAPWGASGPPPVGRWERDMLGEDFESRTIALEPDAEGPNVATIVRMTSSIGQANNHGRDRKDRRNHGQSQEHNHGRDQKDKRNHGRDQQDKPRHQRPHQRTHKSNRAESRARTAERRREVRKRLQDLLDAAGAKPQKAPTFAVLYVHGRNDYFFHVETAQRMSAMGAAFYALDLRKYGRSLRPDQTIGYATDLAVYDREIGLALDIVQEECPGIPVVMMAHSTGGLIAALWAWRNPGRIDGLILNSAWLELQVYSSIRPAIQQITSRVSSIRPHAPVIGVSKSDNYYRSLTNGWKDSGLEIPDYFEDATDDPAFVGWQIRPEWKWPFSYPAPAAWVAAILEGHAAIEKDVHLDIPVLALSSTDSGLDFSWGEAVFSSDVVLDAEAITERAAGLSDSVVIARFPGKHDLLLSDPPVRDAIYATMRKWLAFTGLSDPC